MLSMPTFWAASVTVRPEARQVQAVSSFRSERKRAGGGVGVFLEESGVVAFGQAGGVGEEGDGEFFVQVEVHVADALFDIADAKGVLVGG